MRAIFEHYNASRWPGILAGNSVVGTHTTAIAYNVRDQLTFTAQILIYPALGGDMNKGSYLRHANAPLLTLDDFISMKNAARQD